jgi:hypothetical protein
MVSQVASLKALSDFRNSRTAAGDEFLHGPEQAWHDAGQMFFMNWPHCGWKQMFWAAISLQPFFLVMTFFPVLWSYFLSEKISTAVASSSAQSGGGGGGGTGRLAPHWYRHVTGQIF